MQEVPGSILGGAGENTTLSLHLLPSCGSKQLKALKPELGPRRLYTLGLKISGGPSLERSEKAINE